MFSRLREAAKRVVYFARYEAMLAGVEEIEPEHLLLGIVRDGKGPAAEILAKHGVTRERVEQAIEQPAKAGHDTSSYDHSLSEASKRVLTSAASESEKRQHACIDTDHLLLGLLSEQNAAAIALNTFGLAADEVSVYLEQRWNDPATRRRELVERLGVEKAFQEPSIRERFSDAKRQEIEGLIAQLHDAEAIAFARQKDINEFGLLWAEALALREHLQRLFVD